MESRDFTLLEPLVVVVILDALSALGIPAYLQHTGKARQAASRACAAALADPAAAPFEEPVHVRGGCALRETFTYTDHTTSAIVGQAHMTAGGGVASRSGSSSAAPSPGAVAADRAAEPARSSAGRPFR